MLRKFVVQALSLLLVSLLIIGAIPILAPAVRALDATDLVDIINGWGGGGVGVLYAISTGNDKVTVTGTVTRATQPLILDIDFGVTVVWQAALSGTVDGQTENTCLIRLVGNGTFEIAKNGSISCNGPGGYTINAEGSSGTILVSGGTVSTTSGIAIYAPATSSPYGESDDAESFAVTSEEPWIPEPPGGGIGFPFPPPPPVVIPHIFSDVVLTGGTVSATTGTAILAQDIRVGDGSAVTVTSTGSNPAIKLDNNGSVFIDAGVLTVNGNIVEGGYSINADNGAFVTLNGNIIGQIHYGVEATNSSIVNINGSIQSGFPGSGVYASYDAEVTIIGNITVEHYGVWAYGGATVTVTGDVGIRGFTQGVVAGWAGTTVIVNGNVDAGDYGDGARAYEQGATTIINGNVSAGRRGAMADNGGKVTINGTMNAWIYAHISVSNTFGSIGVDLGINADSPSTRPGYREYTDGRSIVWVALDAQKVEADMAWLTWDVIKKGNSDQTSVTSDLDLPSIGINGSAITWHYLEPTTARPFDLATGVLTRPPFGAGNKDVRIAATLVYESIPRVKYFDLTVLEEPSGNTPGLGNTISNSAPKPEENTEPDPDFDPDIDVPMADSWDNPYDDVVDTDWFYAAVQFVTESGLMNGTGDAIFSPNIIISRAMLVTVLHRLDGKPVVSGDIPFLDVKSGEWYSDAILWASENGIVLGYDSVTFGLNDPVTREQAVSIIHRYAKSKDIDVGSSADLTLYTDADDISDWALDAMKWAIAAGIIQGRTPTTIAPQGNSTRSEIAMTFKRFIEGVGQTPNNS